MDSPTASAASRGPAPADRHDANRSATTGSCRAISAASASRPAAPRPLTERRHRRSPYAAANPAPQPATVPTRIQPATEAVRNTAHRRARLRPRARRCNHPGLRLLAQDPASSTPLRRIARSCRRRASVEVRYTAAPTAAPTAPAAPSDPPAPGTPFTTPPPPARSALPRTARLPPAVRPPSGR